MKKKDIWIIPVVFCLVSICFILGVFLGVITEQHRWEQEQYRWEQELRQILIDAPLPIESAIFWLEYCQDTHAYFADRPQACNVWTGSAIDNTQWTEDYGQMLELLEYLLAVLSPVQEKTEEPT